MKIAIVGSRNWTDKKAIFDYVYMKLTGRDTIISGGASGVDTFAKQAAEYYGLGYIEFPADWKRFGKSAGIIRNAEIVEAADKIVVFWDGASRGTQNTIERAKWAGKPVEVIRR